MLDINFVVKNPLVIKKACQYKRVNPAIVDEIIKEWLALKKKIQEVDKKRAQLNLITKKGKKIIKKGTAEWKKIKNLKEAIKKEEEELKKAKEIFQNKLFLLPNIPLKDVPEGKDETENKVIKKWGKIPQFSFLPKSHFELGENLGLIDTQRAAKVAGSRFGYLQNEFFLLELSLINYGVQLLSSYGFKFILPPVLIKKEMMRAMGYLEHGEEQETYFLEKDNLYLVATAEQSIGPFYANEVLKKENLPLRYAGFSSCFRREAGSYGKDVKGIFRVHQFDKMEMFSFCLPQDSDKEHKLFLEIEEKLVQKLKLPYRVIKMCVGDLGFPAARKYDIECWFPAEKRYRETHSTSTCTDFQARRLNIKYQNKGRLEYIHTVNGTFFSQRLILAILENYQQKDGTVKIPEVLQKYVGLEVIKPKNL